jgi:N-acetylmuramoyl-L-alanine amidase/Phage tail lysozyme
MMPTLPPLLQTPSPNWSERSAKIDLIVAHDCEGSYAGSINWFAQPRSQVSAHLVLREDGLQCTQMVPLSKKAWHACAFNSRSIGVEIAGYSKVGFAPGQLNADANIIAWLLRTFNIPCQWARGGAGPGFCSHWDLGALGGGHQDITTDPDVWSEFSSRVHMAYMLATSVPPWALLGAADSGKITMPPSAPAGYVHTTDVRSDEPLPVWPPSNDVFFARAAMVYNAWRELGVSIPFAVAMTTQAEFESAFEPSARGDSDQAFNLYQWHWNTRGTAILAGCGVDVRTEMDIKKIVSAAWWEMNHTYSSARAAIASKTNVHDAAVAACQLYEGAGAPNAAARRGMGAERWSTWITDNAAFVAAHPVS